MSGYDEETKVTATPDPRVEAFIKAGLSQLSAVGRGVAVELRSSKTSVRKGQAVRVFPNRDAAADFLHSPELLDPSFYDETQAFRPAKAFALGEPYGMIDTFDTAEAANDAADRITVNHCVATRTKDPDAIAKVRARYTVKPMSEVAPGRKPVKEAR